LRCCVDEHREEKELHVSREQSRHARRGALVGHVNDVDAGPPPQRLAEQVTGGPGADRAVVELAGMRAREGDELVDRSRRHGRAHHQHDGHAREERDRREILERIVGKLGVEVGTDGEVGGGAERDGVAVGSRLRQAREPDRAVRTGHVLDHYRLAERRMLREGPAQNIAAACRKRDDEPNRSCGVVLRLDRSAGRQQSQGERREDTKAKPVHDFFPISAIGAGWW